MSKSESKSESTSTSPNALKRNMWGVFPEDVTIIGIDTAHKEGEHPLWDERTELPVDESLVLSILEVGVLEPIMLRRADNKFEVVFGRRRVRAAREANKRLVAKGEKPKVINAITRQLTDRELLAIMITENSVRQGDGPLAKSRALKRLLDLDFSLKECSVFFGVTENAVKGWKKLIGADPRLIEAIHNGELTASAVINLAALPLEEQYPRFLELQGGAPASSASDATDGAPATGKKSGKKNGKNGDKDASTTETAPSSPEASTAEPTTDGKKGGGKKGGRITADATRNVRRQATGSRAATSFKPPRKPVLTSIIEYAAKPEATHTMSADAIDMLKWMMGQIPASDVPGLEDLLAQVNVTKKSDTLTEAQKKFIVAVGEKTPLYSDMHKKTTEALIARGLLESFEDQDGTHCVRLTNAGKDILKEASSGGSNGEGVAA